MNTVSARFPKIQNLVFSSRSQLSSFEDNYNNTGEYDNNLAQQLDFNLNTELTKGIRELFTLAQREGPRREAWKNRISQLEAEIDELRSGFRKTTQTYSNRMARNQLFNTSHINANNSNLSNSQYLHREQQSLENSTKMVEDYQAMGNQALANLRRQRQTLQSAHKKLLDVASELGLSNSLLKMIEKKEFFNLVLTLGCMVFTLIVIGVTCYYVL